MAPCGGAGHSQQATPLHPLVFTSMCFQNAQAASLLFLFYLTTTYLHFVVALLQASHVAGG